MKTPKKRVFTDEDLLRLKGLIKAHETHFIGFVRVEVQPDDVEALIARLKAAERVIALVDARNRNDYWNAHSEWLASKGESNG